MIGKGVSRFFVDNTNNDLPFRAILVETSVYDEAWKCVKDH